MSDDDKGAKIDGTKTARISRIDAPKEQVLQVERRDYPELAPNDRPRSQAMEGFTRFIPTSLITSCAAPTRSGTSAISG